MKPSRAIGVGAAVTAIAGWAWVGCSSSTSNNSGTNTNTTTTTTTVTTTATSTSSGSVSSSSGSGSASSSGGSSSGSASDAGTAPTFAADIYPAIVANCVSCHHSAGDPTPDGGTFDAAGGGVKYGMLDMAASVDAAYAALINVEAMGDASPAAPTALVCDELDAATPGHIRVVPGDAGASLIALKLQGWLNDGSTPPPCGAPMPLTPTGGLDGSTGDDLTQLQAFQAVSEWINGGAQP